MDLRYVLARPGHEKHLVIRWRATQGNADGSSIHLLRVGRVERALLTADKFDGRVLGGSIARR